MSIKTKMTAIADRLRALAGSTDALTLDGMASALDGQQTQVQSAFSAVADMGGTVPAVQLSSTLPDAIRTIPSGVEVRTATGSVRTNNRGQATISCGFRPDLVVFHISQFTSGGEPYENVICFPIAESRKNNGTVLDSMAWNSSLFDMVEGFIESISNTGVTAAFYRYTQTAEATAVSGRTYDWTAVKYTA